ncbi:hypothetical protein EDC01DRAFT_623613 [Geopyxis carbonaria]|nr:hypothetical protein EDC01DRAFT_623613 [Geopyxis carbonaria]
MRVHYLAAYAVSAFLLRPAHAVIPDGSLAAYKQGDVVPVSCLNRTIDNGEHVQDEKTGKLQYIPFALCNETSAPLSFSYLGGEDTGLNCTIPEVSDAMYHLLEFYVHHDTPLSCRIPARPLGGEGVGGGEADTYVPLIFALAGKLELSHLHISTALNVLLHVSPETPGVIDAAAAYSSSAADSTRIVIGDPLPLQMRVRWYASADLPIGGGQRPSRQGGAGQTVGWCVLSALVGAAGCYAWVIGVDFPRRLRRMTVGMKGRDALGIIGNFDGSNGGGTRGGKGYGGYGFPGANGAGNGGGGYGYGVGGKRKD